MISRSPLLRRNLTGNHLIMHRVFIPSLFLLTFGVLFSVNIVFAEDCEHVCVAKQFYKQGEAVIISGKVDEVLDKQPLLIQIFHDTNLVAITQVEVAWDGTYTYSLIADGPHFQSDGKYLVQVNYGVTGNVYETSFDFQTTAAGQNPSRIFEVRAGDSGTFDVPYAIKGGTVKNIIVDPSILGIIVTIQADNDGSITLDLGREWIDAKKTDGTDDTYIIYIDGLEFPYSESSVRPESRLVTIQFQEGDSTIKIIGTTLLGEQSSSADEEILVESTEDEPPLTDLPYSATVSVPAGSSTPGCEETNECYIESEIAVAVGGEVVWSNDDSASHTVTSGYPNSGPDGNFDSSLFLSGQTFSHIFEKAGEFPYFCLVHPWMTGTVFVGQSAPSPTPAPNPSPTPAPNPSPTPAPNPSPTPDIELFVNVDKSEYDLGEVATLTTHISDVSSPQNVAITVTDPFGTVMVSRTLTTDSNGNASTDFKIAESFKTGTYRIDATSSIDGWTYLNDSEFNVISQFSQIQIISAQGTDQQGNPMEFSRGNMGFVKVQVNAQKPIATLITVNVFDSDLTPLGVGSLKTTLNTGQSELILSFMIPEDAVVGNADIYVNALSDWVSVGGIPQTGEFAGQVRIN